MRISANPTNKLNTFKGGASLVFGQENRVELTGAGKSFAPLRPWLNTRIGLRCTWYGMTKFNGASANYNKTTRRTRETTAPFILYASFQDGGGAG